MISNDSKLAVIAEYAYLFSENGLRLTDDKLQKIIYLTQALYDVDFFDYFVYLGSGPFSVSIDVTLAEANALSIVSAGLFIMPGHLNAFLRKGSEEKFLQEINPYIKGVFENFGKLCEKRLNLISSIVYIDKYLDEFKPSSEDGLFNRDGFIKMIIREYCDNSIATEDINYSDEEIQKATKLLVALGYIKR